MIHLLCLTIVLSIVASAYPQSLGSKTQNLSHHPIERLNHGKRVVYLALGDSTGLGVGSVSGNGYVERVLQRMKGEYAEARLIKLCILGATTRRFRLMMSEGINVRPTLVTLSIGINDLLQEVTEEEFEANYKDIVKSLRVLHAPIVVTNLPDVVSTPALSRRKDIRKRLYLFNKRIEAIANNEGLYLVDLYDASVKVIGAHPKYFSSDRFHPSDAGYELWAQIMWPAVKLAMNKSKGSQLPRRRSQANPRLPSGLVSSVVTQLPHYRDQQHNFRTLPPGRFG